MGLSDSSSGGTNTLGGDALCLASAAIYGVYSTLLRKRLKDGEHSNMLFFGYIGLFNALFVLPALVGVIAVRKGGADYQKISGSILGLTVQKGLVDNVLSDLLWSKAVVYTDATVATVCLNIQIPMALLVDMFAKGTGVTPASPLLICGAFFVVLACIGINLPELVFKKGTQNSTSGGTEDGRVRTGYSIRQRVRTFINNPSYTRLNETILNSEEPSV